MGYLIGAIFVIGIIIGLLILATYIAFFVSWALVSWYLGRQLWRQIHRYKLKGNFWVIIIVIGFLSILFAASLKAHLIIKLLVAASLFTFFSVVSIEIWNFRNKKVPFSRLQLLRDKERSLAKRIGEKEAQLADMQDRMERIEHDCSEIIEQKKALLEKVSDFCIRDDAAVWDMRRRRLEEEYSSLSEEELDQLEQELQTKQVSGEIDKKSATLSNYILKIEKLKRKMTDPQKDLDEYQIKIRRLQGEIATLNKERDRICREKKLYEDQIAESARGPITEIREDIMKDYVRFRQFCSRVYQRLNQWVGP